MSKLGYSKDEIEAKCNGPPATAPIASPAPVTSAPAFSTAPYVAAPIAPPASVSTRPAPVKIRQGIQKAYRGNRIAPFTLVTPPGDRKYFVKLVDESSNAPVLTMYVQGGQTFATKAPLGSFRMRYASGATWYGTKLLFGEDTAYTETLSVMKFWRSGNRVNGHMVELIKQVNGNLQEKTILPAEFGDSE